MIFHPRHYQERATQFILDTPKCALWKDMGLGKTAATLSAIHLLISSIEIHRVLVVAPLRVARHTWPSEIAKWDTFKNLTCCPIQGSPQQRERISKQHHDIQTINYEMIEWLVDLCIQMKHWPYDMLVLDESSQVKNHDTNRFRALKKVMKHTDRVVELTGTPSPNGLKDLWSQLYLLDRGKRLGNTVTAFRNRWFFYDAHAFKHRPRKFSQKQIQNQCKDLALSMKAEDYLKLPGLIKNNVVVQMDTKTQLHYNELERDMFTTLAETDTEVEVFNAAALTNKCLQFSNGAVYVDGAGTWEEVHKEKLKALEDIIEEASGMPVLVCYQYKSDAFRLLQYFKDAVSMDKNPKTIDAWNQGEIPILIMHPASAGHGLNLQDGGNIIVFFGMTWNLEHYLQAIERIGPARQAQAGHDRPVFVHHILTQNTLDFTVMERMESKRSVQDLLLDAMKDKERLAA